MNSAVSTYSVQIITVLMLVAAAVAMAVRWVRVPYSIALVIVGLLIGISGLLPTVQMTPELIMLVFLPPLLFEASWNLDWQELRKNLVAVGVLATVGVVLSMVITGACIQLTGMDFYSACLIGAILAATDPISVLAVFRKMGIEKRLTVLLEGESLLNDGTAIVLFNILLAAALSGTALPLPTAALTFIGVALGGVAVGTAVGLLASRLAAPFNDHLLETLLTVVTAYGAYLIADSLHVSPVLSVVAAGVSLGNFGTGISADTREAVDDFWEFAAFLVNSMVFLLIGIGMKLNLLQAHIALICFAVMGLLTARLVVVYGLCPMVSTKQLPIPYSWRHVLFWGGLRGSLSMAMALSLPSSLPHRQEIVVATFGCVLFTLLIPGLTVEPLIKKLQITKADASSQ